MSKDYKNKMMGTDTEAHDAVASFLFPEHGISIQANSREEAEQKLEEILKNKK